MNLNATLIAQIVVFFILGWVSMKYIWPPIVKALDERAEKIAEGLADADKAKNNLALVETKVVAEMRKARESAGEVRGQAERNASKIIDEAKSEANQIIIKAREAAKEEAQLVIDKIKNELQEEVVRIAMAGAEKILQREINPQGHAELLKNLKQELH